MKRKVVLTLRALIVLAALGFNWSGVTAQANGECWDCKKCSNQQSCCPSGSKYSTCRGVSNLKCMARPCGSEFGDEVEVDAEDDEILF